MKQIITEVVIPMGEHKTVYSEWLIKIRVDDEGAGPFLIVTGLNSEPNEGETGHEFFFNTAEEIDQFAAICKSVLSQAGDATTDN